MTDTLDDNDRTDDLPDEPAADAEAVARTGPATPRYTRRLSDKILIAFHQACDQGDHEVAQRMLDVFEFMLMRRDMPADLNRRRSLESLVAAHERLWYLCHPDPG